MSMLKWVLCPHCGKKLCKADAKGILRLWCKSCKKEIEVKTE
jgi:phage FluMu protein Com